MNRLVIVLLVVSLIINLGALVLLYKHFNLKGYFSELQTKHTETKYLVRGLEGSVSTLVSELDKTAEHRLVFLHHSVGSGILDVGGLREKLLNMGILAKSCTYGDDLGEDTDMNHWVAKFDNRMDEVLHFRSHGNQYAPDSVENSVIMFKSCFPNSNIVSDQATGSDYRSVEAYKRSFEELRAYLEANPNKLFVYLTSPPNVPEKTTPENAARAREFNNWLMKEFVPAYQSEIGNKNLFVFDLFDVLADQQDMLKPKYRRGLEGDSHPNHKGYTDAADAFMAFFTPVWEDWQKSQS